MARPSTSDPESASRRAYLTIEDEGVRRTVPLDGTVTVGREPGCDVLLASPTVSRRHAVVARDAEGWLVRDLGSGNGTFLDARRVDEARLPNGVTIRFGSVPAWFEEDPGEPVTAGRKIQRTLTQALSIQPARKTREKAAVAALAGGVVLLLAASVWHRGCNAPGGDAGRPAAASRSGAALPGGG